MLKTRLFRFPSMVLTETHLWGSHQDGWSIELDKAGQLPKFADLESKLPEMIRTTRKANLFLPEIACFPLKIQTDQKIPQRERDSFFKWQLKKRLPFASEDALIKFTPLATPGYYLVFSLPGPWVTETFEFFKSAGIQLGYIGTPAGLFLERYAKPKAHVLLAYQDYYVYFSKGGGHINQFTLRRFPQNDGQIVFDDFFPQDFDPEGQIQDLLVIGMSPARHEAWRSLGNQIQLHFCEGNLAQFMASLGGKA